MAPDVAAPVEPPEGTQAPHTGNHSDPGHPKALHTPRSSRMPLKKLDANAGPSRTQTLRPDSNKQQQRLQTLPTASKKPALSKRRHHDTGAVRDAKRIKRTRPLVMSGMKPCIVHSTLPLAPYKLQGGPVYRTQAKLREGQKETGQLVTYISGLKQVLLLLPYTPFRIGSGIHCDYALPGAAQLHILLYTHVSDLGDHFVICQDKSNGHGIVWNGRKIQNQPILLSHADIIEIPHCRSFIFLDESPNQRGVKALETSEEVLRLADRYSIFNRVLGSGTYSDVLLAWDRQAKRQIACKCQVANVGDCNRFKREVQTLQTCRHPNVLEFLEAVEYEGCWFFFLELVPGGDLFTYISQRGRLSDTQARFISFQLLQALGFMHSCGIAHRDVKPENVVLVTSATDFPHVKLADVGMSWQRPNDLATSSGNVVAARCNSHAGTLPFLSPEILEDKIVGEGYDPFKADSWALGVTIFILLTTWPPFDVLGGEFPPNFDITLYVAEHFEIEEATSKLREAGEARLKAGNHDAAILTDDVDGEELETVAWEDAPGEGSTKHPEKHGDPAPAKAETKGTQGDESASQAAADSAKQIADKARRLVARVFRGLQPADWQHVQKKPLPGISAQQFISGLLTPSVEIRLSITQALSSPWITEKRRLLDCWYDARILGKKRDRTPTSVTKKRDRSRE